MKNKIMIKCHKRCLYFSRRCWRRNIFRIVKGNLTLNLRGNHFYNLYSCRQNKKSFSCWTFDMSLRHANMLDKHETNCKEISVVKSNTKISQVAIFFFCFSQWKGKSLYFESETFFFLLSEDKTIVKLEIEFSHLKWALFTLLSLWIHTRWFTPNSSAEKVCKLHFRICTTEKFYMWF